VTDIKYDPYLVPKYHLRVLHWPHSDHIYSCRKHIGKVLLAAYGAYLGWEVGVSRLVDRKDEFKPWKRGLRNLCGIPGCHRWVFYHFAAPPKWTTYMQRFGTAQLKTREAKP